MQNTNWEPLGFSARCDTVRFGAADRIGLRIVCSTSWATSACR